MCPKSVELELRTYSFALPRRKMKPVRFPLLNFFIVFIVGYVPTANPFVIQSRNDRIGGHELLTFSNRPRCYRWTITASQHASSKQQQQQKQQQRQRRTIHYSKKTTDDNNDNSDEFNYSGIYNGDYVDKNREDRTDSTDRWRETEIDDDSNLITAPRVSQNPDRAISIVSELKANAALFAAFAYGSLNLPPTLTVSESKVTSVTTSLSISRPLPDSDLIRTFVVLDVSTLCLMISCVAASQLLIYRLTDGSYEDIDENYGGAYNSQMNKVDNYDGVRKRKCSRDSALGRLVTTYRNEFAVARITFDFGLLTLLLAVGVRSLAIFDEDIVVPVTIVIGITAFFLAVAYFTTYVEVFQIAENLTERPLFSIPFPFLTKIKTNKNSTGDVENNPIANRKNPRVPKVILPISLVSVGLCLLFILSSGSESSESNLSRLGPYAVTSGATKLKVVTEKIDSEKGKLDAKGKNQRSKEQRRQRNANSLSKKKSRAKAALEKSEDEAAKKKAAEEEADAVRNLM